MNRIMYLVYQKLMRNISLNGEVILQEREPESFLGEEERIERTFERNVESLCCVSSEEEREERIYI